MRKQLRVFNGQRMRFTARIKRFGTKPAYKGKGRPPKTLLLADVHLLFGENPKVTDHLWFTCGKWSEGLSVGDKIAFDARVSPYRKGYRGRRMDVGYSPSTDYKLNRPTKVEKLS